MRQKLKSAFNRHSKSLKRAVATVAAGLTLGLAADAAMPQITFPQPGAPGPAPVVAEAVPAPVTNINDGTMYWKHADYDLVVKTWPCDDRGLCASFQSINEKDPKTRELMALLKGYGKPNGWGFGMDPDPDRVQDWEMTSYCGYEPDVKLTKRDDGSWDGTIRSPFNYQSYGLTVRQMDDGKLKVSGYFTSFPLFWVSEEAERVTSPPPACAPTFPFF